MLGLEYKRNYIHVILSDIKNFHAEENPRFYAEKSASLVNS